MKPNLNMGAVPQADKADIYMPLTMAQNIYAALSNHVSQAAGAIAASAAPYAAITAPAITVKSSGIFLVTGWVTVSVNSGTLAAGDAVEYQLEVNGSIVNALGVVGAVTCTGAPTGDTVAANCAFSMINASAVSKGSTATYAVQVTSSNSHTSGVVVNNGWISVVELPG